MAREASIFMGTSGWHYKHWVGPFYPENTRPKDFLRYYSVFFNTAEINNSFYQLPEESTFEQWRDTVAEDFVFSVKASRYITHMKKLKDPEESTVRFLDRVKVLGDRLGPILFQLPPNWRVNLERLSAFLDVLPDEKYRYVFEFRDRSWFDESVYDLLGSRKAALCIYDLDRWISPKRITADFVYVRLHGPEGNYMGQYSKQALAGWAGAFSTWARQGRDIYCYFDNDHNGYAARDALSLKKMLSHVTG